ncbi:MAG: hypothetical protein HLUCCA11_18895 [Phormidesmis priestleyi Ana]|uniref:Uncharacterized protein n=1 Tax=Phormidesmis priestleyi Ana TaxID=1666911 RepID=A0A0P8BHW4_9CYAN|nr:MAG: hypothetical protein HLUCCA11_18895 [Phormidesmis priestleyi Ana]
MKQNLLVQIACSAAVVVVTPPAVANVLSESASQSSVSFHASPTVEIANSELAESASDYPVIGDHDWRTSANIPYSQPVVISDPFDGDYLAVIDHNFSGNTFLWGVKSGIVTNWSERYIRVYAYIEEHCPTLFCANNRTAQEATSLEIKVGDDVHRLTSTNGNFEVTPELARSLAAAPPGKALTRIHFEGSGEPHTNEIGAETTAAWRVVYATQ